MSQRYRFVPIDRVLAKYSRDFRGNDVIESDAIEWIGEALGFMKLPNLQEEAVAFIEVKDYKCELPNGLHYVTQVARSTKDLYSINDITSDCNSSTTTTISNGGPIGDCLVAEDCQGNLIGDYDVAYYRPYYDLQYEYYGWNNSRLRQRDFVPVRLANHSFFGDLVCRESNQDIYNSCRDEYTIAGNYLKFSFKEGYIAIAYVRQPIDIETGYPMIPEDSSAMSAINYYISWKMKERECFMNREGACQLAQKAEESWKRYLRQTVNAAMMPQGVDDYQDLMEQSNYLIPRRDRYYGFFGKLNTKESRRFNDSNNRNNFVR